MTSTDDLEPIPEAQFLLMASIGRAVCYAAELEKVLLLEVIGRVATDHGLGEILRGELARLERAHGGRLLERLERLGVPAEPAERITAALDRRNWLVHRLLGEFDFVKAIATCDGMAAVIERVDDVIVACQRVTAELTPEAFSRFERLLGMGRDDVVRTLAAIETPTGQGTDDALIDLARIVSRLLEQ